MRLVPDVEAVAVADVDPARELDGANHRRLRQFRLDKYA
jgi:hypothetical protein